MPFDVTALNRDPDLVAVLLRAGDVFSFRVRQISVPPACAALVWEAGPQPRLARSGSIVESEGVRELLFARTTPFLLQFAAKALRSRDGYEFAATAYTSVQIIAERTELLSFRNAVIRSGSRLRADDLQRYCQAAVQSALHGFVSTSDAAALLSPTALDEFEPILTERFKPVGFESGLMLTGDARLTLESPDHARARQAEHAAAARRKQPETAEQVRAAANESRAKHLQDLAALLEQARGLATKSNTSLIEIIKTYDPARRGALYEGLVALDRRAQQMTAVFVAAGSEIIVFDPSSPNEPKARLDLSSAAGPLRSLRVSHESGRAVLLVGARSGVHVVEIGDKPVLQRTYLLTEPPPLRHGFNAAALVGDHLFATHSEAGLVRWAVTEAAGHVQCLGDVTKGAKTVRDVQADKSGRLWFSVDRRVVSWVPGAEAAATALAAPAQVDAVILADNLIYAGLADGTVLCRPTDGPGEPATVRRSDRPVQSLAWLAGGGAPRLLIAEGRPHLDLQVIGDAYRVEYRCRWDVHWGFAAEDWIIGVSASRDQLIIWRIDLPEEPAAMISIGRLCGHSIQDVAMGIKAGS